MIAQDARTGDVLMLGYANRAALEHTLRERRMWFWSRSRQTLWRKGESSGHELRLHSLHADCDADTVLALVEPAGPACHTGARTCFGAAPALSALADIIAERQRHNEGGGYTRRLLADENLRLKKLGEETVELVAACLGQDPGRIAAEAADLLYHTLIACAARSISATDILTELMRRQSTTP